MKSPMTLLSEVLDSLLPDILLSGSPKMIHSKITDRKYYLTTMSKSVALLIDLKEYWNKNLNDKQIVRSKIITNALEIYGTDEEWESVSKADIEQWSNTPFEKLPSRIDIKRYSRELASLNWDFESQQFISMNPVKPRVIEEWELADMHETTIPDIRKIVYQYYVDRIFVAKDRRY